jgi:hypothetical protein
MADSPSIPSTGSPSAISSLGESLLTQQRARNDQVYKRSKNEAYKLALMTAGTGFINQELKSHAQDFLSQESVLSSKVKQQQGYEDATAAQRMKDQIDASGMAPVDYFQSKLMPQAESIAKAQLLASGVTNLSPGDYNVYVQSVVKQVAKDKAQKFDDYYKVASTVQSPEDFATFAKLRNERPTNIAGALYGTVKNMFTGKTKDQIDQEAVDAITKSPEMGRAESVSALRHVFDSTGDLSLALKVGDAINSSTKVGDTTYSIGKDKRPDTFQPVGGASAKPRERKNADGSTTTVIDTQLIKPDGTPAVDNKGMPIYHEQVMGQGSKEFIEDKIIPLGQYESSDIYGGVIKGQSFAYIKAGKAILNEDGTVKRFNTSGEPVPGSAPPELTKIMTNLKPTEISSQQDALRQVLLSSDDSTKMALDDYRIRFAGGTLDKDTGTIKGDKMDSTIAAMAATSVIISNDIGLDRSSSRNVSAQILVDRLKSSTTNTPGSSFLGVHWGKSSSIDLSTSKFTGTPTKLEILSAISGLENTNNKIELTNGQAENIVKDISSEFTSQSPEDQAKILSKFENSSATNGAVFYSSPTGQTIYGVLRGLHEETLNRTKGGAPRATTEDPATQVPPGTQVPTTEAPTQFEMPSGVQGKLSTLKDSLGMSPSQTGRGQMKNMDPLLKGVASTISKGADLISSGAGKVVDSAVSKTASSMEYLAGKSPADKVHYVFEDAPKLFSAYEKNPTRTDTTRFMTYYTENLDSVLNDPKASYEVKNKAVEALDMLNTWAKENPNYNK